MKGLGKYKAVIALLCFTATVFSGCGNRTEAVITDGEDITTVSAEYPTLEESHADIFTYKDLKIGNKLVDYEGNIYKITSISCERVTDTFYNIEVENNHNYYVTENNILVHNKR